MSAVSRTLVTECYWKGQLKIKHGLTNYWSLSFGACWYVCEDTYGRPHVPKWMFFTHHWKEGRGSNPCENIQPKYFLKDASVLVHEGVPYHRKITCNRTFFHSHNNCQHVCLNMSKVAYSFPQDGLNTWHWYWSNTPVLYLCQCCHHQHLFFNHHHNTIDTEFWPPPKK